jgi:hypothetical protein
MSEWVSPKNIKTTSFLLPSELERFKKYCSRLERGFLGFGEALAKEHSIRFAVPLFYCAVSRCGL